MKYLATILTILLLTFGAQAEIRWLDKDYDFGLMKEIAGPRTGRSHFVNLGPDTVSIIYVRPSCGCTRADYTKDPVAPGDTATVSYTYDPAMRPGKFLKSVKVELSDGERHTIKISGNVLGTPESLGVMYPVDAGAMRLTDSVVNAGETVMGHTPVYFVNAYSLSPDTIAPRLRAASPALNVKTSSPTAGPGDLITFSLDFDSRRYGQYGPVVIPLDFTTTARSDKSEPSEPSDSQATIYFRAFVLPDAEMLRAHRNGASPAASLPSAPIHLGTDLSGTVGGEITIDNTGTGPLHILCAAPESDAVVFGKIPKEIKPGKSGRLKFKLDASSLPPGPFRLDIDIITDDPDHPHHRLNLTGATQ